MEYENDLDIFNSLDEESTPQKSSEENVDGKKILPKRKLIQRRILLLL